MLGLNIKRDHGIKILCLGAHCDDIEIGCGGTLLSWLKKYSGTEIRWIVFSSDHLREEEERASANIFLKNAASKTIIIKKFRDGYFPYVGGEIKDLFESLKESYSPDIIFTHYRMDLHQDHRIISELTWNTFRDHFILEYEIPKYDGDFGNPNLYVILEKSICKEKINNILNYYKSQRSKQWFTEDLFYSIMRIRGMETGSSCIYAEAFHCNKILLS